MDDLTKITLKDKKILRELDLNARQSNTQIAKNTRLNKNIVNYRIKKLEELEIITGYKTLFDYSKLGYLIFRIYLDFYEFDLEKEKELIQYLTKNKKAGSVFTTTGTWDLTAKIYVKSVNEFWEEWTKFINLFRPIIKKYHTSTIAHQIYFKKNYLVPSKVKDDFLWKTGRNEPIEIDKTDLIIIKELTENARVPIETLSKITKLGSMGIIYRIRQLIKKEIILGYRANLNLNLLGYEKYHIDLELEDTSITSSLITFLQQQNSIVSITQAISDGSDFEFSLEISNFKQFSNLIKKLKIQFKGKIRDFKYFKFDHSHKLNYLPL
ncbi:winged helix-turn-helix transcriptional regulator [Candidatus Woesearchaeota archaeon]|jgi:Lrp/AsnC family transcriptional regulator, leucine-responsive regulatory protein|nr:winged helix-turn-helix transcriptional regulator [Candidatus Woesearchaeota archaeon]